MRTIQAAIVAFEKPYFIYNQNGCKILPTIVETGSESVTAIETGDKYFTADTIEAVMLEFERLGFQMPEEDKWDFPFRPYRMFLSDSDLILALKANTGLISFFDALGQYFIPRNEGQWIYLEYLGDTEKSQLENLPSFIYEKITQ